MLYIFCRLNKKNFAYQHILRFYYMCRCGWVKEGKKIICRRGNDIIWGVGSWKFHLVRMMNQLRSRSAITLNQTASVPTDHGENTPQLPRWCLGVASQESLFWGGSTLAYEGRGNKNRPAGDKERQNDRNWERENTRIPPLSIQTETLHLLLCSSRSCCFVSSCLAGLRVWPADCSDRHGGIWRWLPETTEEKGEDPQSVPVGRSKHK